MEVRLYITEGDIEDHHVFREKLGLSGLSWRQADLEDADAVIILAGLWGTMKEKIMDDVKRALKLSKPIITVRPYGLENVPVELEEVSFDIVGWNPHCIGEAIEDAVNPEERNQT